MWWPLHIALAPRYEQPHQSSGQQQQPLADLEQLAFHFQTDKSHDDHKCEPTRPHTLHLAHHQHR